MIEQYLLQREHTSSFVASFSQSGRPPKCPWHFFPTKLFASFHSCTTFLFYMDGEIRSQQRFKYERELLWGSGKSRCISEGHGGAGLACGPASAHYIAEQVLGYGFLRWFENKLYHATLTTYPKVCQLLLLSLGLFVKRSLNSGVENCKMYNAMRVLSHTQLNTTECPFCFYFCSKHRRP